MSDAIFKLIGEQLQLVRGKAPEDREIGAWFGDLSNRLGSLQPNRLQVAFTMTREENAERRAAGKYGQLSIDDVIRAYRKAPRDPEDIPEDPYCPHDCDRGETYMIDREGYETLVPCSCQAGEYLRATRRIFKGRRNVDELLRFGWTMKPPPFQVSEEDLLFLMARAREAGIGGAMWEFNNDRRIEPRDENKDEAALLLGKSIGRSG